MKLTDVVIVLNEKCNKIRIYQNNNYRIKPIIERIILGSIEISNNLVTIIGKEFIYEFVDEFEIIDKEFEKKYIIDWEEIKEKNLIKFLRKYIFFGKSFQYLTSHRWFRLIEPQPVEILLNNFSIEFVKS